MRHIGLAVFAFGLLVVGNVHAQVPLVAPPVNLELGIGGGVSLPMGTLSDSTNSGWHAGARARISGFSPINLVGSANYNRLAFKSGGESSIAWIFGAGIEYPIPSMMVHPYLGLDGLVSVLSSTASGASSITREGLGIGGGVEFSVPAFGSFDASVKYQMLNLMGKESGEETLSQVAASLSVMFSVL